MLYFSPSTCGFYDSRINDARPTDCVAVTAEERDAVLADIPPGHRVAGGADGRPIVAPVAPDPAVALARLRARRNALLLASDFTELPSRQQALSEDQRASWAAYRQALRDLPEAFALNPLEVIWPEQPGAQGEAA